MTTIDRLRQMARKRCARLVFPETDDARVAEAIRRLGAEGLTEPVTLGAVNAAQVEHICHARGISATLARRMLERPLIRAAAMVGAGEADAMIAGAANPTRKVIEAAGLAIGLAEGITTPSSFFLMVFPDGRELVFADCAVNVAPDAVALASIARASAASAQALLGQAKVALLSYSTGQSGAGPSVDLVRAAALATGFDGPVQADAALNPGVAARKGSGSGDANVLIFPSLDAGNIAYKIAQELAGAQAIGPFLQGFRAPVCDLSRSATVDDIVAAAIVLGARV